MSACGSPVRAWAAVCCRRLCVDPAATASAERRDVVDVDLGLARDAIKVVEVDLIRAGVAADAVSAAVEDAIAAVAVGAITADDDVVVVVVADPIFAAVEVASAAVAADAISTAGEGAADVVDADAGVVSARSAATVDRSVP